MKQHKFQLVWCAVCVCVALSHAHQWTGTTVNVFSAWIEPTNYDRTQCWNTMNAPTHTTTRYRQIQQDEISLSILTLQNLQINGFKTSAINSIFRFCLKNINRNCCWTLTLILSRPLSLSPTRVNRMANFMSLSKLHSPMDIRRSLSHSFNVGRQCLRFRDTKWFHHFWQRDAVIINDDNGSW